MKYVSVICRRCFAAALGTAGLLAPSLSMADHDVWKTATSGSWSAGASWVDGSPPDTVFDDATCNLPGAYTVSFSVDPDPIEKLDVTGGANVTLASSSRPGNPIVPRTLRLTSSFGGVSVGPGTLTLGTTTGGFPSTSHPFHLTADNDITLGGTVNVKFGSHLNAAKLYDSGHLNITGSGSSVTTTQGFFVGEGAADVTLGGLLQTGGAINAGVVTVSGVGSRWLSSGTFQIGFTDTSGLEHGTLTVSGGGLVESGFSILGDQFGTMGTATVTDSGSLWKAGLLWIGGAGPGTVNVQPGGAVNGGETIVKPQGRLRLQGGTFDAADFSIEGDGQFEWTSGTFHVGTYHGNLSFAVGTLAPGHSPGSTTVLGNYTQQSAGILEIEIGGAAQGTLYDVVNVTENAVLGGQLDLKLLGGFVPTPGQTFVVLNANTITGAFSNVANGGRLPALGGGSFRVNYGPGSAFDPALIVLSAFQSSVTGDFDVDGDVDGNDILVWQRGGSPNPNSAGDLTAWKGNFGFPGLAASGAVPEPTGGWLAILAISLTPFASTHRRRSRSSAAR